MVHLYFFRGALMSGKWMKLRNALYTDISHNGSISPRQQLQLDFSQLGKFHLPDSDSYHH